MNNLYFKAKSDIWKASSEILSASWTGARIILFTKSYRQYFLNSKEKFVKIRFISLA